MKIAIDRISRLVKIQTKLHYISAMNLNGSFRCKQLFASEHRLELECIYIASESAGSYLRRIYFKLSNKSPKRLKLRNFQLRRYIL